ncbi:MAG: NAD(P)/FAD-dependent oxidoreductase [Chitinophagaceae bacterium]|nr:NAD(P)/FAD-dependent oxidoreductase [Chitinophagaceae bacterium]
MSERKKLIVVGGGASGFFCAVNAARLDRNLEVVILEKSAKLLSKVRISGGGRCNVTHASDTVDDMLDAYPRGRNFIRKSLHRFSSNDTINWFAERGVSLKTEQDGRMFPVTDQSQTIINCLMEEAEQYHVKIVMQADVVSIQKDQEVFKLTVMKDTQTSTVETSDFVCIAAGGHPKLSGFDWLENTGHSIESPVPSLFTFNIPDKRLHALMGVSSKHAIVKIPSLKLQETGPVLITHWGLSGPAVLKLSSRAARELNAAAYGFEVRLNWVPDAHESMMLETLKKTKAIARNAIGSKNSFELSARLWNYLLIKSGIDPENIWPNIPQQALVNLSRSLCNDLYTVSGKTTFKEEFVTAGGIKLEEINPLTMESKKMAGLFVAGEVMNVDGITGGYNFQHAWSSGWIAANAITSKTQ